MAEKAPLKFKKKKILEQKPQFLNILLPSIISGAVSTLGKAVVENITSTDSPTAV